MKLCVSVLHLVLDTGLNKCETRGNMMRETCAKSYRHIPLILSFSLRGHKR